MGCSRGAHERQVVGGGVCAGAWSQSARIDVHGVATLLPCLMRLARPRRSVHHPGSLVHLLLPARQRGERKRGVGGDRAPLRDVTLVFLQILQQARRLAALRHEGDPVLHVQGACKGTGNRQLSRKMCSVQSASVKHQRSRRVLAAGTEM